jgi:hypothetical protein
MIQNSLLGIYISKGNEMSMRRRYLNMARNTSNQTIHHQMNGFLKCGI